MKVNDIVISKATDRLYKVVEIKENRDGFMCEPIDGESSGTHLFFEDEVEIVGSIGEVAVEDVAHILNTAFSTLEMKNLTHLHSFNIGNIKLETKEDILALDKAMDWIESRVKEVATYLGFLDNTWVFEDFEIGKENIRVIAYDYYYDLHDTKSTSFPIECILDEAFLKRYKEEWDEAIRKKEEQKCLAEQQRIEDKEKAELERLKAKYEKSGA